MGLSGFQKQYWERGELDKRRSPDFPVIEEVVSSKINEISKYISFGDHDKILDVGAGNGFFSVYLEKQGEVTAVDYSEKMIELNPVKNKFVMDAADLKFPNDHFDIVFESCLLHHVENMDKVIAEMRRVSKKYVIIIEPNRNNPLMFLFSLIKKEERRALRFSLSYLRKALAKHNLKILAAFTHGAIPPNKAPTFMLPLLKIFDKKMPLVGLGNVIICQKEK